MNVVPLTILLYSNTGVEVPVSYLLSYLFTVAVTCTLLVFVFADFVVFDNVRENLYWRKMLFWKLSFLGNFGYFAVFRWKIREHLYPRNTVTLSPQK